MAIVSYPPLRRIANSLFLGGTIDMGKARDWQSEAIELLKDTFSVIYNPRRSDWDPTWFQDLMNEKFKEQVDWELDMIEIADWVLFNFEPDSYSPVTLLELGSRIHRVVVVCPPKYFRKGNVDVFCVRHNIPVYTCLKDAVVFLKANVYEELAGTYGPTAAKHSLYKSVYADEDYDSMFGNED